MFVFFKRSLRKIVGSIGLFKENLSLVVSSINFLQTDSNELEYSNLSLLLSFSATYLMSCHFGILEIFSIC